MTTPVDAEQAWRDLQRIRVPQERVYDEVERSASGEARRDLRDGREHVGLPGRHRSGAARVGCLAGARRISRGAGRGGPGRTAAGAGSACTTSPLRLADARELRRGERW